MDRPRSTLRRMLLGATIASWMLIGVANASDLVAPGLLPSDAGEFQLVVRDLGVAHPPGYPLYTLTAHGFGRGLIGTIEGVGSLFGPERAPVRWLMTWLSVPCAVPHPDCFAAGIDGAWWPWAVSHFSLWLALITLVVTVGGGAWLTGASVPSLLGAATLMSMPVFLDQATTANIRMPTALLSAILLMLTLRWLAQTEQGEPPSRSDGRRGGQASRRTLYLLAFTVGLAATHHVSLVFLGLTIGTVVVVRRPDVLAPRSTVLLAALALLGCLPVAYLPIRDAAGAALAPGNLTDPVGLWNHVTGAGFRGDLQPLDAPQVLLDRTRAVGRLLYLQLDWLGVLLVTVGSGWLLARRRAQASLLLGTVAVFTALAVVYRAPQTVEYLMPAHVALALLAASAGGAVLDFRPDALLSSPQLRTAAVAILAVATASRGWATSEVIARTHPDIDASVRTVAQCQDRPVVLASWHFATPLWTAVPGSLGNAGGKGAQALGPAATRYVHPEGAEPIGETWRRRTVEVSREHPTILTNRTAQLRASGPPLWPLAGSRFWRTAPDVCSSADRSVADRGSLRTMNVTFDAPEGPQRVSLHSVRLDVLDDRDAGPLDEGARRPASRDPIGPARVTLSFAQAEDVEPGDGPWSAVVQLLDPGGGAVYGQLDRTFPAERWADRHGLAFRAELIPFRDALPSSMRIAVGIYGPQGRWTPNLGQREPIGTTNNGTRDGERSGVEPEQPRPGGSAARRNVGTPTTDAPRGGGAPPADGSSSGPVEIQRDPPALLIGTVRSATSNAPMDAVGPVPPAVVSRAIYGRRFLTTTGPSEVPFGDGMVLRSADVRRSGDRLVVDLRWRAERAYRSDYTVSVQATGTGWHSQHDGTPALGAFPTLKWLPGMQIWDRHRLPLPDEFRPGTELTVSVGVYDAFSLDPLPVTSAARVRSGQGQRAVVFDGRLD